MTASSRSVHVAVSVGLAVLPFSPTLVVLGRVWVVMVLGSVVSVFIFPSEAFIHHHVMLRRGGQSALTLGTSCFILLWKFPFIVT